MVLIPHAAIRAFPQTGRAGPRRRGPAAPVERELGLVETAAGPSPRPDARAGVRDYLRVRNFSFHVR
jgi:hypothetical protein